MMTQDEQTLAQARLHFEIQNPSYDDVWLEGYEASQAESEEFDNPYQEGSQEYNFWADGWWAASMDEAPLFDLDGDVLAANDQDSNARETQAQKHRLKTMGKIVSSVLLGSALASLCFDLMM